MTRDRSPRARLDASGNFCNRPTRAQVDRDIAPGCSYGFNRPHGQSFAIMEPCAGQHRPAAAPSCNHRAEPGKIAGWLTDRPCGHEGGDQQTTGFAGVPHRVMSSHVVACRPGPSRASRWLIRIRQVTKMYLNGNVSVRCDRPYERPWSRRDMRVSQPANHWSSHE